MACVAHIAQGLWTCSKLLNSQSHFHFDSQNQLLVPYYFSYFTGEETSQAGPGFCRQSVAESRPLDVRTGLFCLLTGVTTLPWPQPLLHSPVCRVAWDHWHHDCLPHFSFPTAVPGALRPSRCQLGTCGDFSRGDSRSGVQAQMRSRHGLQRTQGPPRHSMIGACS